MLGDDLPDKDNTERPNVNYCRLSGPWASLSMGSLPLRVWIKILDRVEVQALGHTIDPCCRAQMGLGIIGPYTSNLKLLMAYLSIYIYIYKSKAQTFDEVFPFRMFRASGT